MKKNHRLIRKEHFIEGILIYCMSVGAAEAGEYKSTFSVVSVSESNVQSEACAEATLKNKEIADVEFGDAKYLMVTSDKKLTLTDEQTYICQVTILWGVPGKTTFNDFNLSNPQVKVNSSPVEEVVDNSGHLSVSLGQSFGFDEPNGYRSLSGQYLSGTYTVKNNTGYRLIFYRSRISYKFTENGESEETKTFESIGLGIENPLLTKPPFQLLARLDVVDPFPFSQKLKTKHEGETIEENVKGRSFVVLGLPLSYEWNNFIVSLQLSRLIYSEDKKLHPYNYGIDFGYRW